MKSTASPKGRKGSSGEHPVDRISPPARLGDLFLQVFGPSRGASLELPRREPHKPIDLE
jgi:hypothetical protein